MSAPCEAHRDGLRMDACCTACGHPLNAHDSKMVCGVCSLRDGRLPPEDDDLDGHITDSYGFDASQLADDINARWGW